MLWLLANLLCWIPAILGYGLVLVLPRKKLTANPDPQLDIVVEPLFGLLVLSIVVNIINFSIPIDDRVALLLMIAGWIFCALRFRMLNRNPLTRGRTGFLLLWMLFLSFWATQTPHNFDSGLYHMQSIQWLTKSAVPFGLANLHGRLGYNSSWFSIAAAIQLPAKAAEGVNCLSISALLIYFFGIAFYQAWRKKVRQTHLLFFILSVLIFAGAITRGNISSPSPDLAVLFLCVLITYLTIEAFETRTDLTYRLFVVTILALFAFTVKPSSLPLFFLPLSMIAVFIRDSSPVDWKRWIGYTLAFAAILSIPWLLRGVALSGCLNFPIANTCFDDALWTFPRPVTEGYWMVGKASARQTYPDLLPLQQWVGPWFSKMVLSVDFVIPLGLIFVAIFIHLIRPEKFSVPVRWIVLAHLAAILLWFFSAPDIRFAAGYFWSLAFLLFSAVRSASFTFKRKMILAVFVCAVVWAPLRKFSYFGFPPVRKATRNLHNFLIELPIPQAKTNLKMTPEGIGIFESAERSGSCWLAPIPCAPYFDENLRVIRTAGGEYKMFYYLAPAAP